MKRPFSNLTNNMLRMGRLVADANVDTTDGWLLLEGRDTMTVRAMKKRGYPFETKRDESGMWVRITRG